MKSTLADLRAELDQARMDIADELAASAAEKANAKAASLAALAARATATQDAQEWSAQ